MRAQAVAPAIVCRMMDGFSIPAIVRAMVSPFEVSL
jgi:hypothetical protein